MVTTGISAAISYGAAKLWAIPIALGAFALVGGFIYLTGWALRGRKPGSKRHKPSSLLLGADQRLSTSKAVAAAWTAIVLYVVAALLLRWPSDWDKALANLSPTYLLLLGGPYASLVLSKGIVTAKTNGGSLQKTTGSGDLNISDLVSDDSGQTDLFDVQYVLFNLCAMAYVIDAFVRASVGSGLPPIPEGLVVLTGGPAAVYLANKAVSSNPAAITTVTPSVALPGASFDIIGQNFAPEQLAGVNGAPAAGVRRPRVQVAGQKAEVVRFTADRITARVPVPITPVNGAADVVVVTTAEQTCTLPAALTIAPPVVIGVDKRTLKPHDVVTISGRWTSAKGIAPTAIIGGTTVPTEGQPIRGFALQVVVPDLDGADAVDVWLALGSQTSAHLSVPVGH